PSLLAAIGGVVIDNQPPGAKDFVVSLFGTNDKLALEILIVVLATAIGAGLGILAARRTLALASVGFGAFAIAGFFAALRSPATAPTTAMIVALVAGVAGVQVLSLLLGPTGAARIAAGSTVAGVVGRRLLEGGGSPGAGPGGVSTALPSPAQIATLPAGAELSAE